MIKIVDENEFNCSNFIYHQQPFQKLITQQRKDKKKSVEGITAV